jgi:hypothetical protein
MSLAIECRDHMDELLEAINHQGSLIPRLGILGIVLTSDLHSGLNLRISSGVVLGRVMNLIGPSGLQASDVFHQSKSYPDRQSKRAPARPA